MGGAKNSVLKLMAAALLAEGTSVISNCPDILDVPLMAEVLRGLGCEVVHDVPTATVTPPEASMRTWALSNPGVTAIFRDANAGVP